ncbi:PREDICTED: uncharacterized protein LOC109175862 isoform X1 [Ipomoea nil]|uniref:uncharacterized protein LOC109175862 isoform X1 n=1 Tax=Ipomoea nil TaxID=35883 RepID=UPI00090091C7|nr:PREDICTED: uncharacterized protein LOC109175862 isoform X1 [Ipomoea nil]
MINVYLSLHRPLQLNSCLPYFNPTARRRRQSCTIPSHPLLLALSARQKFAHFQFARKRRRFITFASTLELPLLPFPIDQTLIPSETKSLHLYEARYLALLDESLFRKEKLFVHFVLDPIAINDTSGEASFAARYCCLVVIEKVERLDVGAFVSIRGIGRVKIVHFVQAEPYLRGMVIPFQDNIPLTVTDISSKVSELKESICSLNSLEIKLKAPKEELLQTMTANSIGWVKKASLLDCDSNFIPSMAELVSFAALQPVSGATRSDVVKLQKEKLRAMHMKDTMERLDLSSRYVRDNISLVAAKLAIQSLDAP